MQNNNLLFTKLYQQVEYETIEYGIARHAFLRFRSHFLLLLFVFILIFLFIFFDCGNTFYFHNKFYETRIKTKTTKRVGNINIFGCFCYLHIFILTCTFCFVIFYFEKKYKDMRTVLARLRSCNVAIEPRDPSAIDCWRVNDFFPNS